MSDQTAIPTDEQWGDVGGDLDLHRSFSRFSGKDVEAVLPLFRANPIEGVFDLQFVPDAIFDYYVAAVMHLLTPPEGRGETDLASAFLQVLRYRAKENPSSTARTWAQVEPIVTFLSNNQGYYAADPAIFGSFAEIASQIRSLLAK